MSARAIPWWHQVRVKEPCSCVTMQFPKCALCDEGGMVLQTDWEATAKYLYAESERLRAGWLEADKIALANRLKNVPLSKTGA